MKGKTQEEVYQDTGISVCNYEKGNRIPSIENYNTLCEYYDISPGKLFDMVKAALNTGIPVEKLLEDRLC